MIKNQNLRNFVDLKSNTKNEKFKKLKNFRKIRFGELLCYWFNIDFASLFCYFFIMDDKSNELIVSKEAEKIIADGFKAAGINSNDPFVTLAQGLKAEKVSVNKFGVESREEDHATRHKYLVTALELMRILKPNNTIDIKNNVTINSIKLLLPPEYSDRLKGIEGIEI